MAKKSWSGWPSEARRPDMVRREDTKGRSNQRFMPPWNTTRCPVSFYKKSSSHRPVEMNAPKSPFYLAVRHNRRSNEEVWYMKAPLGKKWDSKVSVHCSEECWPSQRGKNVTNHSVRKTCISRLLDADVPENFVAQLSGHKSTESLQSYKSASAKHQKRMSLTLSRADVSGSRDEALSSVHNQGFEVVTRSTRDRCKFDNNYIDWSVKRSVTVFHHSNFYRCKHRIHQRVHIPNISRQCEDCPECGKEASDCYR